MPTPLDQYCSACTIELNVGSIQHEPAMAQAVMRFVATCSFIEDALVRFVSEKLIESDFRVVAELLADLQSAQRRKLIRRSAGVTLRQSDLEVFDKVMATVDRVMESRNRLAHDLWCDVVEFRGGPRRRGVMALVDTRKLTREHARIFAEPPGPTKFTMILAGPKPPAEVYTSDEIEELVRSARTALHLVWGMVMGIGADRDPGMHHVLREMLNLPDLRPRPQGPSPTSR